MSGGPRSHEQLGFDLGLPPAPRVAEPERARRRSEPVAALRDEPARRAIATELDTSLLVEAGAGSGKTTELVARMVALVREGKAAAHEIAAVTFTRKAAGELRQRFQIALEQDRFAPERTDAERALLERALQDIDRAFMGTIHAFCARLLRERPLEAGVDPAFVETTAAEAIVLANRFWSLHLEKLAAEGDPILGELEELGLTTEELRGLYEQLREHPDVVFPLESAPPPDPAAVADCRRELEALLLEADRMMPRDEPPDGWDKMQARVRTLLYRMRQGRWKDDRYFLDALSRASVTWELVQKRWADDNKGKQAAKALCERFNRFVEDGSRAERVLDQWWAHRYPAAMRFAQGAADALAAHRRATGRLDFQDLLVLAARLLRRSPAARADLGRRWKRVLVDEFQDTDPLQAEVVFLLASDPDGRDWTAAVPRPGALFVVGDPKQSIYRFRRADIALYARVRERFAQFGRVLTLTSNFRSGAGIARIVNDVFAPPHGFPTTGDETQAGFASLDPQPRAERPVREGVFRFTVDVDPRARKDVMAEWESEAVAEWIAERIRRGERNPGDFLVLTRKKDPLAPMARALEARGLPVQVSGAGVGVEAEIAELTLLLRALTDPSDPSLTVAVLIGMFFGIDHEQLLVHREAGKGFDFRWADKSIARATDPVEAALACMRGWWELARMQPADVVVARVADDLGLLAHAAAGELGSIRAGALAFVLDAVRSSGLEGDTSLTGALDALHAALGEEEAEAPLEPGRRDVVRLMNLHKAKGLEAKVVVLAAPYGLWEHPIERHVERAPDGSATGWLVVEEREGWDAGKRVIARPLGWKEKEAREKVFRAAEELRLLYVAATRAADELVVSRPPQKPERSPWGRFDPWLAANATALDLQPVPAPARARLELTSEQIAELVDAANARRAAGAAPGYRFRSVTGIVKEAGGEPAPLSDTDRLPVLAPTSTGPGGYEWGSAVHGVLEAAARGASADRLRALARSLLLELDRPARAGEPTELGALLDTVGAVRKSSVWKRADAASRRLAEVPFALGLGEATWMEGVVDLAFREPDGWVIVDYKTDRGDDPELATRRLQYREQLRRYGDAWSRLTGEPVKERVILWTRQGIEETVA